MIVNSLLYYQKEKEGFYHEVDNKLKNVAVATAVFFGDSFHNRELNNSSLSDKEDKDNADILSNLTNTSDVKFVYTMVKKNDKIFFTCSSITLEQRSKGKGYLEFLLEYKGASKKLKDA